MAFSMRRLAPHFTVLACLLACCAPAGAATSTVPASQRIAELQAKFAHKGQTKTGAATTPTTRPAPTTTPATPTATAPRTPTKTGITPAPRPTPRPRSESSAAAAGAIAAQLRALERQGRHARKGGGSSKLSGAALALAIVAGLLALCALLWAAFRFAAIEPRWLLSLRHALAEAGFRASAVWSEFTDWARLGH